MAVDLGLTIDNPQLLSEIVPADWDGIGRDVLDRLQPNLPEPLNLWPAETLYNLWDNYQAHVRVASEYQPPKPVFEIHLFSAAHHGDLGRSGTHWQRAGYQLEEHTLEADHHGLLTASCSQQITDRIAQQPTSEPVCP